MPQQTSYFLAVAVAHYTTQYTHTHARTHTHTYTRMHARARARARTHTHTHKRVHARIEGRRQTDYRVAGEGVTKRAGSASNLTRFCHLWSQNVPWWQNVLWWQTCRNNVKLVDTVRNHGVCLDPAQFVVYAVWNFVESVQYATICPKMSPKQCYVRLFFQDYITVTCFWRAVLGQPAKS